MDGKKRKLAMYIRNRMQHVLVLIGWRMEIRQQHQPYRMTNPMAMVWFWFWFADMSLALDRAIARLQGQGRHRVARALLVHAEKEPHQVLLVALQTRKHIYVCQHSRSLRRGDAAAFF
jgi:hypothetical protein